MMPRDELVDALIERHETALGRVDVPYERGFALMQRARSLGALGRWTQASDAAARAVALDGSLATSFMAAELALDAVSAGQGELAQGLGERLVRPIADEVDEDASVLAIFGAMQRWLGHAESAASAFARLRELTVRGADIARVTRALLHAQQDEELVHHLAALASEEAAFSVEPELVPVVRDWIERLGHERTLALLERVAVGNENISTGRVLGLAHMARGDLDAALEHLDSLERNDQRRLWRRLPSEARARMQSQVAQRFDEHQQHGRLPGMVEDIALLTRVDLAAARPRMEAMLSPRSSRRSRPVLGKKLTIHQLQELSQAAESCGVATGALAARAHTAEERLHVALGRLVAHRHGDTAWKGLRDEAMARMAEMPPQDISSPLALLRALEHGGDGEAALAIVPQIEQRIRHDPAGHQHPFHMLAALRVRWQASEALGRAAPDFSQREASQPFLARMLIRRGLHERALALLDSLTDAERLPAITGALDEVARPQEREPMF